MAFQLPEIGILTLAMMVAMLHGGINLAVVGTANLTAIITALVIHALTPTFGSAWHGCSGLRGRVCRALCWLVC